MFRFFGLREVIAAKCWKRLLSGTFLISREQLLTVNISSFRLEREGWREQSVSSPSFFDPLERAAFFTGIKENN